jgi:hypothetical protein
MNLDTEHPLVGAIIVAVSETYLEECFQIRLADGEERFVIFSQDDEGNGPGTYFLTDEEPDMDELW